MEFKVIQGHRLITVNIHKKPKETGPNDHKTQTKKNTANPLVYIRTMGPWDD